MRCDHMKTKKIMMSAALAATVIALLLSSVPAGDLSAEQTYDQDYGEFWSDTLKFIFSGDATQAQEIEWDFGDGSPISTEWNPEHTYEEPGVYYVTQVVSNSYDGGSSATAVYKVTVNGHPYVNVVMPDGEIIRHEVRYNTYPSIDDPELEDRTFVGFFTDEDLTQEYTLAKVTAPVTIYAGFEGDVPDPVPAPGPAEYDVVPIAIAAAAIILGLVAAYTRSPIVALIALILVALIALQYFGILNLPTVNVDLDLTLPEVRL